MRNYIVAIVFVLQAVACLDSTGAEELDALKNVYAAKSFQSSDGRRLLYRQLSPPLSPSPSNSDGSVKFPLVVFLHGAGERGNDNQRQLIHGMKELSDADSRYRYPAFVVAPQCPSKEKWVDARWTESKHTMQEEPTDALRLTVELIHEFLENPAVDADRIYLVGLSMGGFGVWDIMQRHPQLVAGSVAVCGGADESLAVRIAQIPVWVAHGEKDSAVVPDRSRNIVAALRNAGGRPVYTEYKDVGHNAWTRTFENRLVWDWLFSQRRQASK